MSEYNDWKEVYHSSDKFAVELVKAHLDQANINCVILDQQDSMVKTINETDFNVRLFVHPNNESKALEIIEQRKQS
jgi:S-methylmethionine-dependent homocysteine/selenocysteine methylase